MLLSIAMIIKNEEKYLNKTLSALKPLMKRINSELIILDTGSTDSSIEISKKYTNKVYFEKWNNNFSDMRNKCIGYTSGDWILIIDADEELINYNDLIKFFESDLCNKYNCASIELKNISSEKLDSYSKVSIPRLFKNNNFKYEGAIHEQPLYKGPIYNNIAIFNHYGYIFDDEEFKQKKLKRNEKILLSEIESNPNNPYINYQLAKNFSVLGDNEEALCYVEKSFDLYNEIGFIPPFVKSNMARMYINAFKYDKCEELCNEYIKYDKKNIDIYYYLALSQSLLGKSKESLSNYKRYIYLLDNYELSSQSNSIFCDGNTVGFREKANINIVKIYYRLEMYEEIIEVIKKFEFDLIKQLYKIVIMSLYKLNKFDGILKLYNKSLNSNTEYKEFIINLEQTILSLKKSDRNLIYKLLSDINDNYGTLNKVRLRETLNLEKLKEVLLYENDAYFGEILYYGLIQNINLAELLANVSYINIKNYIDYIVMNRRECVIDLYNYLSNVVNTLDTNKIGVYSCISRSLLFYGNLSNEKYENIFRMYIMYKYNYISKIYNQNLSEEELLNFVIDKEDAFIINIVMIEKVKNIDKLEYVRKMKELLINNQHHKKGIEMLIDIFEEELKESNELKKLKLKYKSIIEENINIGNIKDSVNMIEEYNGLFKYDKLYNMRAIISIYQNNIEESERLLKLSYLNNKYDENTLFNIGYIKEVKQEFEEALSFYTEALDLSCDEELNAEILNKINYIKNIKKGI